MAAQTNRAGGSVVRRTQHPHWSRLGEDLDPDGIKLFRNAVRYVRDNLLQSCTV